MTGAITNILTGAQNAVVQSIKNTQRLLDKVQLTLATGKDVNSAIDNPANFFSSRSLSNRADDLMRLMDGISQSIGTIKGAAQGSEGILHLLDQAGALLDEAGVELYSGTATSLISSLSASDIAAILAANPGVTYSAATKSFYKLSTVPASWTTANITAQSSTLVEPPGVEGVAGVTGHLVNITSLQENNFVDALAPGTVWLGGSDAAVEGEWRWVGGPESGQQFWQGTSSGSPVGGSYAHWGGGEPNNSGGNEDGVHMRADGFWNDQNLGTSYNYVTEWDESLFVTPADAKLAARADEYSQQYLQLLDQIDLLAKDTQYRGINLLKNESLRTDFNPDHTSFLISQGIDGTSSGLGLSASNFLRLSTLNLAKEQVRDARENMRAYSGNLALDLSVITTRSDFTQATINIHKDGSSKLVRADQNETGAELLALQTSQQLQTTALQLSMQSGVTKLLS